MLMTAFSVHRISLRIGLQVLPLQVQEPLNQGNRPNKRLKHKLAVNAATHVEMRNHSTTTGSTRFAALAHQLVLLLHVPCMGVHTVCNAHIRT